ncbi:hypothetical protein CA833_04885 [Novosphingobium sp. KA1]|nr:hypothetical protein CA833_04885 [Novosphingobium sp. KA1]
MCRYFKTSRRSAGPFWANPAGTPKWLPSRTEAALDGQPARPAATSARAVRHLGASMAAFMRLRPNPQRRVA